MPIATCYGTQASANSSWTALGKADTGFELLSGPSTGHGYPVVDYSAIPVGSTIHSATMTFTLGAGSGSYKFDGADMFQGMGVPITLGGSQTYDFRFTAIWPGGASGSITKTISNIVVTVNYTPPGTGPDPTYDIGTVALDKSSMDAGETLKITLSKADSGVIRKVTIRSGTGYDTIRRTVESNISNANTVLETDIPLSWCDLLMPSATSIKLQVRVEASGVSTDTVATTFTLRVPSSVVPTIGGFAATRQDNGVDPDLEEYVQGYSKIKLDITAAAGARGSTITKKEIYGDGFAKEATGSAAALSATFGPLPTSGTIKFTAKVTDNRGRTATVSLTVPVRAYTMPQLSDLSVFRSNEAGAKKDDGEYAALKAKRSISSINGKNTATMEGRVYPKGGNPTSWQSMSNEISKIIGGLSVSSAYVAQIRVTDKIRSYTVTKTIATSSVDMNIRPGAAGVAFGEYAEVGKFKTKLPIYSNGILTLTQAHAALMSIPNSSTGVLVDLGVMVGIATVMFHVYISIARMALTASDYFEAVIVGRHTGTGGAWENTRQLNRARTDLSAAVFMIIDNYYHLYIPWGSAQSIAKVEVVTNVTLNRPASLSTSTTEPAAGYSKSTCTKV